MSSDPSPLAVPAGSGAPTRSYERLDSGPGDAGRPAADPCERRSIAVDEAVWYPWWRDLIVERHREDRFDAFVPLPVDGCTWEHRVALGRVVEHSMAGLHGPSSATQLVVDALDAAGFGRVHDLEPDARRSAMVRAGWRNDPWRGDDDLRLGVLGSVADALLREVPPTSAALDLRRDSGDATAVTTPLVPLVQAATRAAVLAYARHVERLAIRSRTSATSLQF